MKVAVCGEVAHRINKKKCTIFSVDPRPGEGGEVVTGGQDGAVNIWRRGEKYVLAQSLRKHTGAVLCVRYDRTGRFIASCGDEGALVVWMERDKAFSLFKVLEEQKSDISNVSWSARYLAASGYDGSVCIYALPSFSLHKRLEKHGNECKGLSFSPSGLFLVTQGDEGVLNVYDGEFTKRLSVSKPFKGVHSESFFSRMSWSPDGKYLAACLAFSEKRDAVVLLGRSFSREYTLLGHVAPVEVVSFNPKVFSTEEGPIYVLATGAQDKSVCIWSSGSHRPVVLLKEMSTQPIMDLRWSSDGSTLYVCGYDGSFSYLLFRANELGTPTDVSAEEGRDGLVYSKESLALQETLHKSQQERDALLPLSPFPSSQSQPQGQSQGQPQPQSLLEDRPRKKIVPRLVAPLSLSEKGTASTERVVLFLSKAFPTLSPFPLHPPENAPFSFEITVEGSRYAVSSEGGTHPIRATKDGFPWLAIEGLSPKILSHHGPLLAVLSSSLPSSEETLWIYSIPHCSLVLPAIALSNTVYVDVLDHHVLILNSRSLFKVLNLATMQTIEDHLPTDGEVLSISLDPQYFLLLRYTDGSLYFYNPPSSLWMVLETASSIFNDVFTSVPSKDSTLESLESAIEAALWVKDPSLLHTSFLRFASILSKSPALPPSINKFNGLVDKILGEENSASLVEEALAILNTNTELQRYVFRKRSELTFSSLPQ